MVEHRQVILSHTLSKRLVGNGIINIKIKLYFGEKASFKMLINDGKILEDQLHFVQRPENENGLFTVQILRKCQREINTP